MLKRLEIRIYGNVQGVFFRYLAFRRSQEMSINGFAQNEPDGSVYIEAEGEEEKLKEFLEWCKKGPKFASVTKVDFNFFDNLKNFKEFAIK